MATTYPALEQLLRRARAPLGPPVHLDLGEPGGPLGELARLLSQVNGFTLYNAGVQVYHAGPSGLGPELQTWNAPTTWKDTYSGLAEDLFCFGQDLFGTQFAIEGHQRIVAFDPETAQRTEIGDSLQDWAAWLHADPAVRGTDSYATAWQHARGALGHDERLIPRQFFTLGGSYEFTNLIAQNATTCMRIRGPLAQRLTSLPDGTAIRLSNTPPVPSDETTTPVSADAQIEVFADYNLVLLQDADARPPRPGDGWTDEVITNLIAARPGTIAIGTARRMSVPVTLQARPQPPTDTDLSGVDHVAEASITLTSGTLLVLGPTDQPEQAFRLHLPAGSYRARVSCTGFDTLSEDGLDGDDTYRVHLWPAPPAPTAVLKRSPHPMPGG